VWHSSLATGELTLLSGTAATAARGGAVPAKAPTRVLPFRGDDAATIGTSTAPRLLALAEPVDSRWGATLNGAPLQRATAYGWAQAFVVPPHAGTVRVQFDSGGRHWWLVLELLGLGAVVLVGAGAGSRPHRQEPL
jgi:hypothetical protein